ncbi:MAG: hypothetical protein K0U36_02920 [Alphaproteobacteria bacterium]|nr:hypothetical protein [Alphaproteobacteria bacterium]
MTMVTAHSHAHGGLPSFPTIYLPTSPPFVTAFMPDAPRTGVSARTGRHRMNDRP